MASAAERLPHPFPRLAVVCAGVAVVTIGGLAFSWVWFLGNKLSLQGLPVHMLVWLLLGGLALVIAVSALFRLLMKGFQPIRRGTANLSLSIMLAGSLFMMAGVALGFYQRSLDEPRYTQREVGGPDRRVVTRDGWNYTLPPDDKLFFSKIDGRGQWSFSRPYVEGMDVSRMEPPTPFPPPSYDDRSYANWDLFGALQGSGMALGWALISIGGLLLAMRLRPPQP